MVTKFNSIINTPPKSQDIHINNIQKQQIANPNMQYHQPEIQPMEIEETVTFDDYMKDLDMLSQMVNRKIQFSMESINNEMIIRIVDKETDEVLREYPPEELRELHQKLRETAEMLGLIIDAEA